MKNLNFKRKILVTGAAGYIGGTFAYEALNKGISVFGIDNFLNSTKRNIDILEKKFPKEFKFLELDISEKKNDLKKAVSSFKPDVVAHFAGLKAVGEAEEKPDLYWKNNVNSTLNILDSISPNIPIIFSSSATVYGQNELQPLTEKTPLTTTSVYGQTKIASENMIKEYSKLKGYKGICLRYFNPVGSHSDCIISENFNNKPNNLMPKLIETVMNGQNKICIFGNDYKTKDGTGERDYIHIKDLIEGHFCAIEKADNIKGIHCYNLGTGKATSVLELIKEFNKANNTHIRYQFTSRRKGDVDICYADPSLAEKELKWIATQTLHDMCKDAFSAAQSNKLYI